MGKYFRSDLEQTAQFVIFNMKLTYITELQISVDFLSHQSPLCLITLGFKK